MMKGDSGPLGPLTARGVTRCSRRRLRAFPQNSPSFLPCTCTCTCTCMKHQRPPADSADGRLPAGVPPDLIRHTSLLARRMTIQLGGPTPVYTTAAAPVAACGLGTRITNQTDVEAEQSQLKPSPQARRQPRDVRDPGGLGVRGLGDTGLLSVGGGVPRLLRPHRITLVVPSGRESVPDRRPP